MCAMPPSRRYWETVELLRKLVLTSILALIAPGSAGQGARTAAWWRCPLATHSDAGDAACYIAAALVRRLTVHTLTTRIPPSAPAILPHLSSVCVAQSLLAS
jgi:hypothetical protein